MFKYCLVLFFLLSGWKLKAQDSLPSPPDTLRPRPDTARPRLAPSSLAPNYRPRPGALSDSLLRMDSLRRDSLRIDSSVNPGTHPPVSVHMPPRLDAPIYKVQTYYRFTHPVRFRTTLRQWHGKEAIFYALIALLLFFALVKNGFRRYIRDLFRMFFRTTVNHRQMKDQLVQSPIPSLLLNLFFVLSTGMFVALLLQYFRLGQDYPFWIVFVDAVLALAGIYLVKFLSLKLLGWIFQVREATDNYIFIVFTANKVIGMVLLPFVVLLAFASGLVATLAVDLGLLLVVSLFIYRFFLSYVTIRRQVRINFLHFFLYLCAFELVPLLLINKLLFSLLGETY